MSEESGPEHHHTMRERLDAAEAAADEVVSEGGDQLGGELSGLAVPLEQLGAAIRAALDPDSLAADETIEGEPGATEPSPEGTLPADAEASPG